MGKDGGVGSGWRVLGYGGMGRGEGWGDGGGVEGEGREGTDVLVTNTIYGERSVACAVQHITHCS